ncbi:MAG: FAD:protein FMN transferase [Lentimicrobium sp.]|nr:FAD:protein FMN transferase [Lentimicrobium sp.]
MTKIRTQFALALVIIISLSSCRRLTDENEIKIHGMAQGTYYAITFYAADNHNFKSEIDSFFKAFDRSASVYLSESVISRFNNNDPATIADEAFITVFNKAFEVSEATQGAFDITTMPLTNAWGFGFTDPMKLDSAMVDSLLKLVDYRKISLVDGQLIKANPDIKIDYNAIAQGYSADLIGKMLREKGIDNYLIDVGGEVLASGKKPDRTKWKVGIEKPSKNASDDRAIDVIVELENKALASSGNYRRYFVKDGIRYSHTINPKTGFPVNHTLLSVSVLANDCMTADAYATAFMVMGLEKAKEFLGSHTGLEAHFIYTNIEGNYETWTSPGLEILIVKNK